MKEFYVIYHIYWINHIVASFTQCLLRFASNHARTCYTTDYLAMAMDIVPLV